MATDGVESRLLTILQLIIGWLLFAEAKNTGLVALAGVSLSGILAYLATEADVPQLLFVGLLVTGFFLLLSLGVALLSFLPRTDPATLRSRSAGMPDSKDNLYFFHDIQKYQPEEYARAIARLYGGFADYDPTSHRSHTDLAAQIIANSRIIAIKNDRFRTGVWLTALALASGGFFTALDVCLKLIN